MRALVVAAAVLAAVPAAAADIGIVSVAPRAGAPGTSVAVRVDGYLQLDAPSMPVVLVRADAMPRPYACKDGICEPIVWRDRLGRPPYRIVGLARRWIWKRDQQDHADAIVRFRVPRVPPGRYQLALWCGPCVRGPQGSLIAGPLLWVR